MPVSKAPYKRGYHQTKGKGRQSVVTCSMCGSKVPRFKTFTRSSGFRITDSTILKSTDRRNIHTFSRKQYICPKCARFYGVVEKRKNRRYV
ncbi:MAG: hypothetical protein DRP11_00395 [Candidatus Aenigmatarchaeota archaeon]|nr:MAG: hypothetical protein DRP11_00395 [Candidatus Aenigmarchaeota archaeon]